MGIPDLNQAYILEEITVEDVRMKIKEADRLLKYNIDLEIVRTNLAPPSLN